VDRRGLENRLKPLLAAPPEMLSVNRKGLHPFDLPNRLAVVAFSNERAAIALPSDDRRWLVLWSHAGRLDEADAAALWAWYDQGGRDAVAGWLAARDVSAWNPAATPPMTEAKVALVGAGRSLAESWMIEHIEGLRGEFARGVVAGPWQGLCDRLQGVAPPGTKLFAGTVLHALAEAGWIDLGLCHSRANLTKRHVFTAPDWAGSKSAARDAVEAPVGGGALASLARVK